jgi:PTS system ascorbate-specific IIA component
VACHAFGRYIAEVVVADIAANSSLDDAVATIETIWKQEGCPQQVVLLGDILGATPCNAACAWLSLHPEIRARGLTGVSVPMMLKAFTYRELPPEELVEKLADTVSPSCAPLAPAN